MPAEPFRSVLESDPQCSLNGYRNSRERRAANPFHETKDQQMTDGVRATRARHPFFFWTGT
jgi:hypothetical protein